MTTWRSCIAYHYVAFTTALFLGWDWNSVELQNPPPVDESIPMLAVIIIAGNMWPFLVIVASNLFTAGGGGVMVMVYNGYYIGGFAQQFPWIVGYVPFEIASFCVAGAASMRLSLELYGWFFSTEAEFSVDAVKYYSAWLAVSLVGIFASAVLEAVVIHVSVNW